ncbi:hypothetical protein [Streptomyces sp. NPDC001744]|uniref:hypothetical protein n=1 Tax=Streptomyces sp. NPDC001744 TaxID=3364606 RepID=UPI0036893471
MTVTMIAWLQGGEMTGLRLFRVDGGSAEEVVGSEVELERHLQTLIEQNMDTMLGTRFLASEYSTGPVPGGRIGSLGLDEDGSPVVVEYKRSRRENVINQALFYSARLRDHKVEFEALVARGRGCRQCRMEQSADHVRRVGIQPLRGPRDRRDEPPDRPRPLPALRREHPGPGAARLGAQRSKYVGQERW